MDARTTLRNRHIWTIAAVAGLLRLLMVAGLELYSDEAYYWLWSRRLAFGYFDHPPMVAWLARFSALVPGEIGLRLPFVICGALAVVFTAFTARELTDDPRAPVFAGLLAAAAPMLTLHGAIALPDAPVEAAYAAALFLLARARERRWVAAGIAVGLALLSKYTAALLAPALFVLVLWDPELRAQLRTRWPWIGGAVAVALFAPVIAWNAAHQYVSFRFQLHHGFGSGASLESFLEYVGGQIAGIGPVAFAAGIAVLVRARTSAEKRVAAATFIPLLVTTYSALRGHVEANWPSFAYPGLCAAGGVALARLHPRWGRGLATAAVTMCAIAAVGFSAVERWPSLLNQDGARLAARFNGWKEFSMRARALAASGCAQVGNPAGCEARDPFVVPTSYQVAGMLAWYAGWQRFAPASERPSQLDIWNDAPAVGESFLYVGEYAPDAQTQVRYPAEAAGPTVNYRVVRGGLEVRSGSVTPYLRFKGGDLRRLP